MLTFNRRFCGRRQMKLPKRTKLFVGRHPLGAAMVQTSLLAVETARKDRTNGGGGGDHRRNLERNRSRMNGTFLRPLSVRRAP